MDYCPGLLSVAMINTMAKKQLSEKKGIFGFPSPKEAGAHSRISGPELHQNH